MVKSVRMNENAVLAIFPTAAGDPITSPQVAKLDHLQLFPSRHHRAIHAALRGESPVARRQLEIFRKDGGRMIPLRRHPGLSDRFETHRRRSAERWGIKIGRMVLRQAEFHRRLQERDV